MIATITEYAKVKSMSKSAAIQELVLFGLIYAKTLDKNGHDDHN
jgi:hypothetical protein